MPDNSSGFIDFNQYSEQNAPEEQRLLEAAMQRAEGADSKARLQLQRTYQEARDTGAAGLSSTASYSDYLKVSREATAAWAAVTSRSRDPRLAALQASIGGDAKARAGASATEATDREQRFGKQVGEDIAEGQKIASARDAHFKAQADAKAEREAASANATENHLQTVYGKWMGAHAEGGGTSDRNRYAQILSQGVDSGWKLPDRLANAMGTHNDRRGYAIENDAWGTAAKPSGRPSTKKGTAY